MRMMEEQKTKQGTLPTHNEIVHMFNKLKVATITFSRDELRFKLYSGNLSPIDYNLSNEVFITNKETTTNRLGTISVCELMRMACDRLKLDKWFNPQQLTEIIDGDLTVN